MEASSQVFRATSFHPVTNASTEFQPQVLPLVIPILLSILFLACLVLNSTSLWIFWFHIKQWNSSVILQFNLVLTDAFLIPIVPLIVAYFSLDNSWLFGQFLCRLKIFILSTHLYGSIYFLRLISIHRYLAVVHYSSRTLWKKSFLKKLSLFVWFLLSIQGLPLFIVLKTSSVNGSVKCMSIHQSEFSSLYVYYNIFLVTVNFLLLFGISLTCYALLGATIAKMNSTSLWGRVMKTKSLQMIMVSLAIFVICSVPLHVSRTIGVIVKYYNLSCERLHQVEIVYYASWLFTMVNCCLNPLIYNFASEKFNESFSKSLRKFWLLK
ncbi:P2Y purinoceptor 4-like [Gopherus flavomarginatus]|uniref:P2Y purinoceptor 4-like n=1 Tax=Gopherus flavomarginatus TaxID=286002 RepID=UPI0021CC3067|nr:P2Y purinoceptor 4-like [Gopherus flavomarginatus]